MKRQPSPLLVAALLMTSGLGQALPTAALQPPSLGINNQQCLIRAAQEFNVPAPVLAAIQQERQGPTDPRLAPREFGPMGLGEAVIDEAERQARISSREAKTNPCQNFRVAAWLLSKNLKHAGGDLWKAVGWYQFGKDTRGFRKDMAYRYTKHIQHLAAQRESSRDATRMASGH